MELAHIEEDVLDKLHSDFRLIARYVAAGSDKDKVQQLMADNKPIAHPAEFLDVMSTLTNDTRYREIEKQVVQRSEREEMTMCIMLDMAEEKGIEKGIEKGENCFAILTEKLLEDARTQDLMRATRDKAFRREMYREYGIMDC